MSEGRWEAPVVAPAASTPAKTRYRVLSVVLALELVWLLLVAASVVFLAAHLNAELDDFTGGPSSRRMLLLTVPPLAVGLGLALIGARQAVDRRATRPVCVLSLGLRLCLWLTALANIAVVISIATSLYHAHTTWVVVGVLLAIGLSLVAATCVRAAHPSDLF